MKPRPTIDASVDDLLAWLRDALMPMEIEVYLDGVLPTDGFDVWVNVMPDYQGKYHYRINASARTLHESLSQIVDQVVASPPAGIDIQCVLIAGPADRDPPDLPGARAGRTAS